MAFHAKLITTIMCVCVFVFRACKLMETRKNCVWKYWAVLMRKDRMRTNQWISNYPIIQGKTFEWIYGNIDVWLCWWCVQKWMWNANFEKLIEHLQHFAHTHFPSLIYYTLCVTHLNTLNELNWAEMKLIWNETTNCLFNKQKLINI